MLPARVRKPRDKAKAEVGVQIVQRWILAALRHRTFFSLSELNAAIALLLERLNARAFRKLPGSRRSLFEQLDRPALRPLPTERYVFAQWKKVRVNIDYHVEVALDLVQHAVLPPPYRAHGQTVPHGGGRRPIRPSPRRLRTVDQVRDLRDEPPRHPLRQYPPQPRRRVARPRWRRNRSVETPRKNRDLRILVRTSIDVGEIRDGPPPQVAAPCDEHPEPARLLQLVSSSSTPADGRPYPRILPRGTHSNMLRTLVAASLLALSPVAFGAGTGEVLEVTRLAQEEDSPDRVLFAVAADLSGVPLTRVGVFVLCDRSSGRVEAGFSFGAFPTGITVQPAVFPVDGPELRLGILVRAIPASGFHSPYFDDPAEIRAIIDAFFVSGARASNGHHCVVNRLPEEVNIRVRERAAACPAGWSVS